MNTKYFPYLFILPFVLSLPVRSLLHMNIPDIIFWVSVALISGSLGVILIAYLCLAITLWCLQRRNNRIGSRHGRSGETAIQQLALASEPTDVLQQQQEEEAANQPPRHFSTTVEILQQLERELGQWLTEREQSSRTTQTHHTGTPCEEVVIDVPGYQNDNDCAICLSEAEGSSPSPPCMWRVLVGCQHKFHSDCIKMWLAVHLTCPLCRNQVPAPMNII